MITIWSSAIGRRFKKRRQVSALQSELYPGNGRSAMQEINRMYCSTCGVAVAKGVSFCNYCGAKFPSSDTELEFREVRPGLLVSAMAGIFVLGMPGIVFLMFMTNAVRLDPQQTMAFAWTSLLLLLALELVFLFLLLRRRPRRDETGERDHFKGSQTNELEMKHAAVLAEPIASVTEHTTRAFEPLPRERI